MAIQTPRGLKIHLPTDYSFALIARLYPDIDAFQFLKTTEGVMALPAASTLVVALCCFAARATPQVIATAIAATQVLSHFLRISGRPLNRFILSVATAYSYFSGFGILLILLLVMGFFLSGWKGVGAYVLGRLAGSLFNIALSFLNRRRIRRLTELDVEQSELSFLSAYLYHARELGKTLDISVTAEELEQANWQPVLGDLNSKWPQVAARITDG